MKRSLFIILAPALLAVTAFASVGASSGPDFRELFIDQLQGYREQMARADAAESIVTAHEAEIAQLTAQNAELRASVQPLRDEVDRLKEYERYASLERDVEGLRRTKSRLQDEIAPVQAAYNEARGDLMDAWADNQRLADILDKYGSDGVWLNRIVGTSMEPALGPSDLVLMMNTPGQFNVGKWGDFAYFKCSGKTFVHRAVAHDGERYTMRGDANEAADPCRPTHAEILWLSPSDAVIQGVFE